MATIENIASENRTFSESNAPITPSIEQENAFCHQVGSLYGRVCKWIKGVFSSIYRHFAAMIDSFKKGFYQASSNTGNTGEKSQALSKAKKLSLKSPPITQANRLGIANPDNTCYINSVLQSLAHLRTLSESALFPKPKEGEKMAPTPDAFQQKLRQAFFQTIAMLRSDDPKRGSFLSIETPKQFRKFAQEKGFFKQDGRLSAQEDAQEFANFLFDQMGTDPLSVQVNCYHDSWNDHRGLVDARYDYTDYFFYLPLGIEPGQEPQKISDLLFATITDEEFAVATARQKERDSRNESRNGITQPLPQAKRATGNSETINSLEAIGLNYEEGESTSHSTNKATSDSANNSESRSESNVAQTEAIKSCEPILQTLQLLQDNIPPFLCLQLKRFSQEGDVAHKIKRPIDLLETLSMPVKEDPSLRIQYQLRSVVVHRGKTLKSGHYITLVRDGQTWTCYSDQKVYTFDKAEDAMALIRKNAYLVHYEKVETS